MLHTGDHYEARARQARHLELRRLARSVSAFLWLPLFRRPRCRLPDLASSGCEQPQHVPAMAGCNGWKP